MTVRDRSGRSGRWVPGGGVAAAVGGLLWSATPWVQSAVLGDRPYVASAFDVASLLGWVLMAVGLVGVSTVFGSRYGRLGRTGVGVTAAGMVVAALPTVRSVARFVAAGFRAVPAVGEDPAGLLLTWATLLGLGLTLLGAGVLGLALRRVEDPPTLAAALLVSAPVVASLTAALSFLSLLPLPPRRLLVHTNAALLPFGLGWVTLGVAVRSRARDAE